MNVLIDIGQKIRKIINLYYKWSNYN